MPKEVINDVGSLIINWDKNKHAQIVVDLGNPFIFVDREGRVSIGPSGHCVEQGMQFWAKTNNNRPVLMYRPF